MLKSIIPASAPNATIPKKENAYNTAKNTIVNMAVLSQLIAIYIYLHIIIKSDVTRPISTPCTWPSVLGTIQLPCANETCQY